MGEARVRAMELAGIPVLDDRGLPTWNRITKSEARRIRVEHAKRLGRKPGQHK